MESSRIAPVPELAGVDIARISKGRDLFEGERFKIRYCHAVLYIISNNTPAHIFLCTSRFRGAMFARNDYNEDNEND